uniref:ER membrane protein complex subunit 1 n=1 Tax=Magallana gigas TaxID=29159 RepID=K1PJL5_MAGGI
MSSLLGQVLVFLIPARDLKPNYIHLLLLILHREEGTIPYIPELPVNAEAIINYNQSLYNVQGIHTSPAGLESTSLVLSYGLAVLLGMFVVTIATQKLSARRALSRAWK